jgi:hypothetical protein
VPGTQIPEGGPRTPADGRPSTWLPHLVAAFDSGFKLSDHVGGYWYDHVTVAPLRAGLASLVVDTSGHLQVGVWGRDLTMTPTTAVVRQNLRPLVDHGISVAQPGDGVRTWGKANHDTALANRSALATLPDGALLFAYAHDVTAYQLAQTLVRLGAVEAIDLDMNRSWPTGFVYAHHGTTVVGHAISPYVVRPPSTYFSPFRKDFIAVEAAA